MDSALLSVSAISSEPHAGFRDQANAAARFAQGLAVQPSLPYHPPAVASLIADQLTRDWNHLGSTSFRISDAVSEVVQMNRAAEEALRSVSSYLDQTRSLQNSLEQACRPVADSLAWLSASSRSITELIQPLAMPVGIAEAVRSSYEDWSAVKGVAEQVANFVALSERWKSFEVGHQARWKFEFSHELAKAVVGVNEQLTGLNAYDLSEEDTDPAEQYLASERRQEEELDEELIRRTVEQMISDDEADLAREADPTTSIGEERSDLASSLFQFLHRLLPSEFAERIYEPLFFESLEEAIEQFRACGLPANCVKVSDCRKCKLVLVALIYGFWGMIADCATSARRHLP